ncbi:gephyrin-like molybdotransferase Glp [Gryllotalpicola protaetiae]|uniref:Molybdopterin molybdenumtransferase n=1 Tax=Gryllotalpicola protaetiae TaxID=2419771 RepID=A0A387BP62_9MICO|nr:gephyrin-like molybdotransferase Glp [Gryllotalpicola protaetiae]AYG02807.1 molybdopterin molybdenumtransferase MoeA [Gryllotalpicola protaetiae]
MSTVAEHQAAVRALVSSHWRPATEYPPLGAALGRVLADDVRTPIDLPPFDNSQMDGYAVRADAAAGPLRVSGHVAAGDPITAFPGGAVAIMTGAPVPLGADAIVPVEAVGAPGEFAAVDDTVELPAPVEPGSFVRARGSDLAAGAVLLEAGTVLGPAQLGALAASGLTTVPVRARPRVLIVSTGAELAEPGEPLAPGAIYDANAVSLSAAITLAGGIALATGVYSDEPGHLRLALEAAGPVDLVVTSGGVSAGAHEVVRDALEPLGVRFGSVALQPGGPQGLGAITVAGAPTPVLCFPGNPVSSLVSFELFLRPLLRGDRPVLRLPLSASVDSPAAKHQVRRGRLTDAGTVELVGGVSSHLLAAYARSDALVHLPVGLTRAEAGEVVEVWRIDE